MSQKNTTEIAERITEALRAGTVPWLSPYLGGTMVPRNLKSKRPYRGINLLLLALSPHAGRWFVTYKQAAAMGGQVRKGEKGTRVFFWMEYCPASKTDGRRCTIPGHTRKDHPFIMRGYTVFNAETQVDGLEDKIPATPEPSYAEGALDVGLRLVDALDGYDMRDVREQPGVDAAGYSPDYDFIVMPPPAEIRDGIHYYWTGLHELVHSTGHSTRLDRHLVTEVGKEYAREELVAEIGSCIAARTLGFEPDIENSAAYVAHWLGALEDDPDLVTIAAQRAAKAVDLLFAGDRATIDSEEEITA